MPFEPPGYEPVNYEPANYEPWATAAPGSDPDRHPDPDLTVFVEAGVVLAVFVDN